MSQAPHDLRDYLFDELRSDERLEVEAYLSTSAEAREELDRLRTTQQALRSVPDEEMPRRIGFISDKVFEPSRARRWWLGFSDAAPRFGFSMAAVLLVLFAGMWAVQPTITSDSDGWRIAVGGVSTPLTDAARSISAADEDRIEQLVRRIAAEQSELQTADLTAVFEEQLRKESAARKAQVDDVLRRSEEAYMILYSEQEKLERDLLGGFTLASAER